MRDAFGVKRDPSLAALIEIDGRPTLPRSQNTEVIPPETPADNRAPNSIDREAASRRDT